MKALREAHGGKGKKKQKKDPTTSTMKKMTKQISALTAAIASSWVLLLMVKMTTVLVQILLQEVTETILL